MVIAHVMRPPVAPIYTRAPTTQNIALVMGSGGNPFEEYEQARAMCEQAGRVVSIIAGNDMIERFAPDIDHAASLHPDKLPLWLPRRRANGYNEPPKVWAHRNYEGAVTDWTRDWDGSTGLFMVKVMREQGFTHILLCGVPMTVEDAHFIRGQPWNNALSFQRGWNARLHELRPYVRSLRGWTMEKFGPPSLEWLGTDIEDRHIAGPFAGLRA